MRALILAAGLATRMREVTQGEPKCLLKLHGKTLLELQLDALEAEGVTDVTVVTGHCSAAVEAEASGRAQCVYYPDYASTNNLLTLRSCLNLLDGETLILFSDIVLDPRLYGMLLANDNDAALLVDRSQSLSDTMRVTLSDGAVTDIGPHISPEDGHGNFTGIAKFSARGASLLRSEIASMCVESHRSAYYTEAIRTLIQRGEQPAAQFTDGMRWRELDTPGDYRNALVESFYLLPAS